MKKFARIVSALCSAAISASMLALAPSAENDWKTTYSDFLTKQISSDAKDNAGKAFSIFDLNGDDVPELIYSPSANDNNNCAVYTYADGKLVSVGKTGYLGRLEFEPANQTIINYSFTDTTSSFTFEKISENTLKTEKNFVLKSSDDGNYTFSINGKKVGQDQFIEEIEPMYSGESLSLGRTFRLNQTSITCAVSGVVNYKKAYSDFLSNCYNDEYNFESPTFYIAEITGDKIPELFIHMGFRTEIYTFNDGRISYIGEDDFTDVFSQNKITYKTYVSSDKKNLMFAASCSKDKTYCYTFYRINNGHLEYVASLSYDINVLSNKRTYTVNDAEVSKSEFSKALKEYRKSGLKSVSKEYAFSTDNFLKVFG